jgi:hypothetical protein
MGVPRDSRECPIALAFEEITGERPDVKGEVLNTYDETYVLPRSAERFIERFDCGLSVKPFAFTIRA